MIDISILCRFQSPNGVQIALKHSPVKRRRSYVSITKRCTDCFSRRTRRLCQAAEFQSPNGVQIAFSLAMTIISRLILFQSPNGVQIAFPRKRQRLLLTKFQSPNGVQIAFAYGGCYANYLQVSITKRCTDCFRTTMLILSRLKLFQSPNGVQIVSWRFC